MEDKPVFKEIKAPDGAYLTQAELAEGDVRVFINAASMFSTNNNLTVVPIINLLVSLDLGGITNQTTDSIMAIVANSSPTSLITLTVSAKAYSLLTDDQKSTALAKNILIASA